VLGARRIVEVFGHDLAHTPNGDSGSLLDREWMLGRLELDEGSLPVVSEVHHGLQILGLRKPFEGRGEPAKERALVSAMRLVVELEEGVEVLAAQGDPDAPDEGLRLAENRNLETTPNEEELVIDHTGIGIEATPPGSLRLGNSVVVEGRRGTQAGQAFVALSAGRADVPHRFPAD
jgi:hypothetical protein